MYRLVIKYFGKYICLVPMWGHYHFLGQVPKAKLQTTNLNPPQISLTVTVGFTVPCFKRYQGQLTGIAAGAPLQALFSVILIPLIPSKLIQDACLIPIAPIGQSPLTDPFLGALLLQQPYIQKMHIQRL